MQTGFRNTPKQKVRTSRHVQQTTDAGMTISADRESMSTSAKSSPESVFDYCGSTDAAAAAAAHNEDSVDQLWQYDNLRKPVASQGLVSTTPPERVIHSRPKQEWAEEERAVAAQYAIHLFRPRNYRQEEKDGPTAAEQGMAKIQHMNRGPPSAESPKPVIKVGSATKMKGDPYVKKTQLPNSQARKQLGGIESPMRMHISKLVRIEGGIPPLVALLESTDCKVQRAAAGALRTLTVFLILVSIWVLIWQVGAIGNLVHSSVNIKKEVLSAGALQPVISLLRCLMMHLFEFCINLIRHITTNVYFLL